MGPVDQSLRSMHEALTLAEQLAHPYTRALALAYAAMLYQFRGEPRMVRESTGTALTLCREQGFAYYLSWATIMHGWALTALGQEEAGITRMREGMAAMQASGAALRRAYYLGLLGTPCGQVGRAEGGLDLMTQALTVAEQTGEHWNLAELYRRKGDLFLDSSGREAEAEGCFRQAVDIASRQHAKALELLATTSLTRCR